MALPLRLGRICLGLVGLLVALASPVNAFAQAPTCPEAPAAPGEGFASDVAELRLLRIEQAQTCAVLGDSLSGLDARASRTATATETVAGSIDTNGGDPASRVVYGSADSVPVAVAGHVLVRDEAGQTLAVSDGSAAEAADAGFTAIHSALWFLAGLGSTLVAGYALYRQVSPRA